MLDNLIPPYTGTQKTFTAQQAWMLHLPIQMQSVLMLGMRGHDGLPKETPSKNVLRAYRGTVLNAAKYGRPLRWGESLIEGDSFMSLHHLADDSLWDGVVHAFVSDLDQLSLHFVAHLMHGMEIIGYKHPDNRFARCWMWAYEQTVHALHLQPETEVQLNARLGDWGRKHWDVST